MSAEPSDAQRPSSAAHRCGQPLRRHGLCGAVSRTGGDVKGALLGCKGFRQTAGPPVQPWGCDSEEQTRE